MAHARSQINVYSNKDFIFTNYLKGGDYWRANGSYLDIGNLDDNGYPLNAANGGVFCVIFIPNTVTEYTGAWIIDWQGTGQMRFGNTSAVTVNSGGGFVTTTNPLRVSGSNGLVNFNFNETLTNLSFAIDNSTSGDHVHNIRIYRADQDPSQTFNPDFITKMKHMNCGILRFMGLQQMNNNNLTRWSYRGNVNDWSYFAQKWMSGAWAGVTAGTDTYTSGAAPDTPASWTDGEAIQVRFTNANTVTTPTLNVNGRGAKTIVDYQGNALAVGAISVNLVTTLTYDGDLDKVIIFGIGANLGITAGIPYETVVALCNAINANPWVCMPFAANDDYTTQAATYLKANLNAGLIPYLGFSNEVWNYIFGQTDLASKKALAVYGLSQANNEDVHAWYAHKFVNMASLIKSAYGSATNYKRVIEVQAFGNGSQYDTYRFKGSDLTINGNKPPLAPDRPIDNCEVLSFASYIVGANIGQFDSDYGSTGITAALQSAADSYAAGGAGITTGLNYVDTDVRTGDIAGVDGSQTLESLQANIYTVWQPYAVTYNKELSEYEGGLAISAPSTGECTALGVNTAYSAKIGNMIAGYKADARFNQFTLDRYNYFVGQAQAGSPSQFGFCETFSATGAGPATWVIVNGDLYTTPYTAYDAIATFNTPPPPPPVPVVVVDTHDGRYLEEDVTEYRKDNDKRFAAIRQAKARLHETIEQAFATSTVNKAGLIVNSQVLSHIPDAQLPQLIKNFENDEESTILVLLLTK